VLHVTFLSKECKNQYEQYLCCQYFFRLSLGDNRTILAFRDYYSSYPFVYVICLLGNYFSQMAVVLQRGKRKQNIPTTVQPGYHSFNRYWGG